MKKIMMMVVVVWLAVFALRTVKAHAEDVSSWTATDIGLEVVTQGLLVMDWGQTSWAAKHRYHEVKGLQGNGWYTSHIEEYEEKNVLLSKHPSSTTINIYFPAVMAGHALVAHYLPTAMKALGASDTTAKYSRTVWQSVFIGVESYAVGMNYSAGIKMSW